MGESFDKYYYDRFNGSAPFGENATDENYQKSKIEIAAKSVAALLDHLNANDRFGMVLFDSIAYPAKPLSLVGDTDMGKIKGHILKIQAMGGTQLSAGMKMGTNLFGNYTGADQSEYENRIIFLTDAMPNLGDTSEEGLLNITEKNSASKIYATFIGMGVDFNTELVEYITKIRGANYYSVHSANEFKKRMDEEFEYMVTPLVFNLTLNLDAKGYSIEKVYGSPEANEATGEIMKVNTLFPSKKEEGQTKGGLVLLKLKKLSPEASLNLRVSYEDREGKADSDEASVSFEEKEADFFQNTGIRKGILLSRYADLMKNWINDERKSYEIATPVEPSVSKETGIIIPGPVELGKWERQSIPLKVSEGYKKLFNDFSVYFQNEMGALGDDTLGQEVEILKKLGNYTAG